MNEIVSRETAFREAVLSHDEEIHYAAYADWLEEQGRDAEATALRWMWHSGRRPERRQRVVPHGELKQLRDCWAWEAQFFADNEPYHLPLAFLNHLKGVSPYPSESTGTLVLYDIWQEAILALGTGLVEMGEHLSGNPIA